MARRGRPALAGRRQTHSSLTTAARASGSAAWFSLSRPYPRRGRSRPHCRGTIVTGDRSSASDLHHRPEAARRHLDTLPSQRRGDGVDERLGDVGARRSRERKGGGRGACRRERELRDDERRPSPRRVSERSMGRSSLGKMRRPAILSASHSASADVSPSRHRRRRARRLDRPDDLAVDKHARGRHAFQHGHAWRGTALALLPGGAGRTGVENFDEPGRFDEDEGADRGPDEDEDGDGTCCRAPASRRRRPSAPRSLVALLGLSLCRALGLVPTGALNTIGGARRRRLATSPHSSHGCCGGEPKGSRFSYWCPASHW